MMVSAGKVLFFATSFALLSRCRFGFPRSDLLRHQHRAVYATSEDIFTTDYAAAQSAWYVRPWARSAQMILAILFACATTATFQCFV